MNPSDEDDEDNNNNDSDEEDDGASSTYDGVEQLFAEEEEPAEEDERKEKEILDNAKRIQNFKVKVLDLFDQQKDELQKRIRNALDVQVGSGKSYSPP